MSKNQDNSSKILLGLKYCEIGEVREDKDRVVVKVTLKLEGMNCSCCGSLNLYRHGKCKPRQVLHSRSNGRRIYLELHRQRWQCRGCGHTFSNGEDLTQPRSRLTKQAQEEALWQLKDRSFSQVRRELGVNYSILRRLLEKETDEDALAFTYEEEVFLGID